MEKGLQVSIDALKLPHHKSVAGYNLKKKAKLQTEIYVSLRKAFVEIFKT